MENKIRQLLKRFAEVEEFLGQPNIVADQKRYRALTQEHSYLSEVKHTWEEIGRLKQQLLDNVELLKKRKIPILL